jgi:CubicO group peptidase (beta-lactamase class C family)
MTEFSPCQSCSRSFLLYKVEKKQFGKKKGFHVILTDSNRTKRRGGFVKKKFKKVKTGTFIDALNLNWVIFILTFLLVLVSPATSASEAPPITRNDVEAFLDGIISSQLEEYRIPAATVSLVVGNEVLLSKGYGRYDVEVEEHPDPVQTIFRAGSVSKLFIWTALAQLAEKGKLEFDRDVNTYLEEVEVPERYDRPVTLRNIFTHTSGFEEKGIHLYAPSAEKLLPLQKALKKNQPARVRPPGEIPAYSNYATAIAGQVISNVSGTSYYRYLTENLFRPLEMENSTFRQPVPENLDGELAKGYTWEEGRFVEGDFEFVQLSPGGSMSSTAGDMANFMIAHLNNGEFKGEEILSPEAMERMHRRQFAAMPEAGGLTMGFIEIFRNGKRVLLHGGDTYLFHSGMFLIPDEKVGIFVSYNAPGGGRARMNLLNSFLDRYFPASKRVSTPGKGSAESNDYSRSVGEFTGSYRSARSNFTTFEKVRNLFSPIEIKKGGEGKLLTTGFGPSPTEWRRIGELTFENASFRSDEKLFFSDSGNGENEVMYLFAENNPTTALIKLPWWGSYTLHLAIPVVVALFFFASFLAWILSAIYRRLYRVQSPKRSLDFRITRWVAGITMISFLIFLLSFSLSAQSRAIIYGLTPSALISLVFGMAGAFTAAVLVGLVIRSWLKGSGKLSHRLHWSAVVLFSLVFIWWMNYWNLLGIRV